MKSAATALVSPMTAAFVAPYTYRLGMPRTEGLPDEMLMIEPLPRSSMPGRNAWIVPCIDFTFKSKEKSQSASEHSNTVP
jgi:hypothetical protein